MNQLRRLAIVTGGAGLGIGSGVSRALAGEEWDVLVADRDEALAARLVDLGRGSMRFVHVELTDDDAPQRVVEAALTWRGQIDGLVNNAGVGCVCPSDQVTDEQFDRTFSVNVRACFRLTREVVKHLSRPGGAIVNIASVHGRQPLPGFSVYAATKGAVEAMTRGWAVDFGSQGIRVNSVMPGMVDCAQTRDVLDNYVEDVDAYLNHWIQTRQLLPQLVTNADVGELVAFLLGSRSQGITGQSIVIDAGTTVMLTDRE